MSKQERIPYASCSKRKQNWMTKLPIFPCEVLCKSEKAVTSFCPNVLTTSN